MMTERERSVVITGGASGIGAAVARLIVERGGSVCIVDLDDAAGAALVAELEGRAFYARADVCDVEALEAARRELAAQTGFGGIVTCAGIGQQAQPIAEMPAEVFETVLGIHATGTFLTCKVFGQDLVAHGGGAVVTVSSVLSVRPGPVYAYGAGKAAITNFTRALAVEWAPKGIRVNAIQPGWVDTPLVRAQEAKGRDLSAVLDMCPMGRLIAPGEVAEVVHFLLSPASSAMTGSVLVVDGGITSAAGWLPYGPLPR